MTHLTHEPRLNTGIPCGESNPTPCASPHSPEQALTAGTNQGGFFQYNLNLLFYESMKKFSYNFITVMRRLVKFVFHWLLIFNRDLKYGASKILWIKIKKIWERERFNTWFITLGRCQVGHVQRITWVIPSKSPFQGRVHSLMQY